MCKGVARGAGGKGKEIYEFAVTATASAFSPTFFKVRTKQRGKRRETPEAGETRVIFPRIDVALADECLSRKGLWDTAFFPFPQLLSVSASVTFELSTGSTSDSVSMSSLSLSLFSLAASVGYYNRLQVSCCVSEHSCLVISMLCLCSFFSHTVFLCVFFLV